MNPLPTTSHIFYLNLGNTNPPTLPPLEPLPFLSNLLVFPNVPTLPAINPLLPPSRLLLILTQTSDLPTSIALLRSSFFLPKPPEVPSKGTNSVISVRTQPAS